MGNYIDCCRKPYTVQYGAELPLGHCDTNINDLDQQGSPGKKIEKNEYSSNPFKSNNLNNQTIRRNSVFSPKMKDYNNLGTELNDLNSQVKYKDDFMKNFTLMLQSTYGSVYDSLFFENEFELNYDTVHNFLEKNKDSIPLLNLFIYNSNDLEKENNFNLDDEEIYCHKKAKKNLNLNPFGLYASNPSLRQKNDGITIFGIFNSDKKIDIEKHQILVDYVLDLNFKEYEEILNLEKNPIFKECKDLDFIPIFAIKFDLHSLKYYIKDLFSGISTIYKVNNETVLKNNSLITIGDSYILITFGDLSDPGLFQNNQFANNYNSSISTSNTELINMKVFNKNGQLIHDPINFQPSKSCIRIGRSKDNEIVINDPTISRTHCTIQYDEVVGWTIRDGHFQKKDRKSEYHASTNSTWVYVGENSVIVDGLILRCGSLTIQFSLDQN